MTPLPKKKKKQSHPGMLGVGLLGAGLGTYGLGHALLNKQEYDQLGQFREVAQKQWQLGKDPRASIRDYVHLGHQATNARPLGLDVTSIMKTLRNPDILTNKHIVERFPNLKEMAWNAASGDHYSEFKKSPLDAYLQLNRELVSGQSKQVENTLGSMRNLTGGFRVGRPGTGAINEFLDRSGALADTVKAAPDGRQRMVNSVSKLMEDTQAPLANIFMGRTRPGQYDANYYNTLNSHVAALAKKNNINLATSNPEQKAQLFNQLDDHIKASDPKLWKQKQFADWAMGRETHFAGGTYGKIIAPFQGASDALKYTGIAAAAAGAGIGGYALYKILKNRLAKKKAQALRPQVQSY